MPRPPCTLSGGRTSLPVRLAALLPELRTATSLASVCAHASSRLPYRPPSTALWRRHLNIYVLYALADLTYTPPLGCSPANPSRRIHILLSPLSLPVRHCRQRRRRLLRTRSQPCVHFSLPLRRRRLLHARSWTRMHYSLPLDCLPLLRRRCHRRCRRRRRPRHHFLPPPPPQPPLLSVPLPLLPLPPPPPPPGP